MQQTQFHPLPAWLKSPTRFSPLHTECRHFSRHCCRPSFAFHLPCQHNRKMRENLSLWFLDYRSDVLRGKISRCFIWCASRPSVRLGSNHWISKAILTVITVFAWLIIKSMPNRSESQPGGKKIIFSAITVLSSVQTEIADGRAPIWSQTLCNLEAIWPHFQISNVKRWKKRWGNGSFSIQVQTERDVQPDAANHIEMNTV